MTVVISDQTRSLVTVIEGSPQRLIIRGVGTQGATGATGPSGGVNTFNTRTGEVVSANGDYTASQVTNVPAGSIAATTVQAAINELDSEKQAALGFTPENLVFKVTSMATTNNNDYPTTQAVADYITDLPARSLQDTTNIGSTTTNVIDSRGFIAGSARLVLNEGTDADGEWVKYIRSPGSAEALIYANNVDAIRTHQLPNADGTYALSLNGVAATDIGDLSATLDSVSTAGNETANSIVVGGISSDGPAQISTGVSIYNGPTSGLTFATLDPSGLTADYSHVLPNSNGTYALSVNGVGAGTTGNVVITKSDLSLGNVDNTSDVNKPVSTATQTALDLKVDENAAITGATKTKITYDAKGLVTGGADATTADVADSSNKRYVTDAQLVVIGNTSGTNTGDQTATTVANTPAGNIAATTVQAAINELDSEKETALTFSTGTTRTVNTITANLSTGVSGGQSVIGGTASGEDLTLSSTSNATKGMIVLGSASAYDEVNDRLGISTTSPSAKAHVSSNSLGGTTGADSSGLLLDNVTAAALNAQQVSPPIVFVAQGWGTSGGASQEHKYKIDVLPVQGTNSAPTFRIQKSTSGGAYIDAMSFNYSIFGSNNPVMYIGSAPVVGFGATQSQFFSGSGGMTFYNNAGSVTLGTMSNVGAWALTPTALTGSSAVSAFSIAQTWNTSGNPTLIFANVTNTASGASANLIDLQLGGSSRFLVTKGGAGTFFGNVTCNTVLASTSVRCGATGIHYWNGRSQMASPSDGVIQLSNGAVTDFDRLQLGGSTSSFPAVSRNGATIEAVLADDSGFAAVQSLYQRFGSGSPESVVTAPVGATYSRTDGGAGTSFYVKESGTGNTGWVAK